eukprot:TRINITY_DN20808_c0_g1_i2.p2 TRINITY_DN20808_c0_g1~~TRINITY_DN20808_c0_g1_i2.p2  ORF type:complete len:200 (-),score=-12.48 TRINITY_DN20808_c0_g1_i2:299-898(-)
MKFCRIILIMNFFQATYFLIYPSKNLNRMTKGLIQLQKSIVLYNLDFQFSWIIWISQLNFYNSFSQFCDRNPNTARNIGQLILYTHDFLSIYICIYMLHTSYIYILYYGLSLLCLGVAPLEWGGRPLYVNIQLLSVDHWINNVQVLLEKKVLETSIIFRNQICNPFFVIHNLNRKLKILQSRFFRNCSLQFTIFAIWQH